MRSLWFAATMLAALPSSAVALAAQARAPCAAIARHVDGAGGPGPGAPLFLLSYEPGPGETRLPGPLATTAFSYDNALAITALVACGDVARARRIGDAFVDAARNDRTFDDGRIRNAYRAGPVGPGPVLLPGWWDHTRRAWSEDAYQDGSQTGNVAWVALALLTLEQATHEPRYLETARSLAAWIANHTRETNGVGGFSGGVAGFDKKQVKLTWRSTEHNVDVHALGTRLQSMAPGPMSDILAQQSKTFLDAMFDARAGMFRLGTLPDGARQPTEKMALDALLWPLIGVQPPPAAWHKSLDFAVHYLATDGGFDFNGSHGGIWTEGTAQASLVMRAEGETKAAERLLSAALQQASPSGYLYATDSDKLATGLAVGPDSKGNDFFYYRRPHLGATAWAALAANDFNPFTGSRVY